MNKELTLEQWCAYLPYKLKVIHARKKGNIQNTTELTPSDFTWLKNQGYVKPILRPLSDLTKEIEVNGEKFVPIVELAKIAENRFLKTIKILKNESGYFLGFIGVDEQRFSFAYFHKTKSFLLHSSIIRNSVYPANQLEMFNKLYEWHFDIHNLIEQRLAIDINTLDN
jgi:hypothetical protein